MYGRSSDHITSAHEICPAKRMATRQNWITTSTNAEKNKKNAKIDRINSIDGSFIDSHTAQYWPHPIESTFYVQRQCSRAGFYLNFYALKHTKSTRPYSLVLLFAAAAFFLCATHSSAEVKSFFRAHCDEFLSNSTWHFNYRHFHHSSDDCRCAFVR